MTEPRGVARELEQVVAGVWRWGLDDDRIGGVHSDAYALASPQGCVLIDPLPLERRALERLGAPSAICLTAGCHQRSSWRYRGELGVRVVAPEGAFGLEQEPDATYRDGDELPGGLRAIRTPGPEEIHFALLSEREPRVLFCADLVMNVGGLDFVPAEFHEDPARTRESVRRLCELDFAVLCLAHGEPIADDPHAALRRLLAAAGEPA